MPQPPSTPTLHILVFLLVPLFMLPSHGEKIPDILRSHQQKIFQNYKSKYKKRYKDQSQQLYRNLIVYNNANKIATHNFNANRSYSMGINAFADLGQEEFRIRYTGYQVSGEAVKENIRLDKKRREIDEKQCSCDTYRTSQITLIEQRQQIVKNYINSTKEMKKRKKEMEAMTLDKNINEFAQNIPFLTADQFEVTAAKMKEIQANQPKSILKNTTSTSNLKKDDPTLKVTTQTITAPISTTTKTTTTTTVKPQTTTTTSKTTQPVMTEMEKQVLASLGDKQITTSPTNPINPTTPTTVTITTKPPASSIQQAATVTTPILKQTLPSTTSTTTTTSTTSTTSTSTNITTTTTTTATPTISIDWSNYTGAARYQGNCGSCYAIVALGNLQALFAMYTFGFYVQMSPQQVIDCADNGLTFGCDGGYLEGAFTHLKYKGTTTQLSYPYKSGDTGSPGTCKSATGPFKITDYRNLPGGDCLAIKKQLQKKPISIAIASFNLQFYLSGTFNDCDTEIDHAVLLVGYHSTKGWKIKNSWGSGWGESGYAWIQGGNSCGICQGAIVTSIVGEPVL